MENDLAIRRADTSDIPSVIDVAAAALGWNRDDPNEAFFRWKHFENPAGVSPIWLAMDNDRIAGFRAMLRWEFLDADGSTILRAARAVDTATHPDYQRRGVFKRLTMAAVDELTTDGVDFIFNTPNDNSRPGYLRMGWREAGRIPTRFAIHRLGAIPRLARARTSAEKWSEPGAAGTEMENIGAELDDLTAVCPPATGIATRRSADHLRWRYGFSALHYRLVQTDNAAAIIRVRRRGAAKEVVLAELFSPDPGSSRALLGLIRRQVDADYTLTLANPPHPSPWLPTLPKLGPRLTVRDLAGTGPALTDFRFALGDIELF